MRKRELQKMFLILADMLEREVHRFPPTVRELRASVKWMRARLESSRAGDLRAEIKAQMERDLYEELARANFDK